MDILTLFFWGLSAVLIIASLVKSRERTAEAARKTKGMMGGMLGEIVAIIFLIGLLLAFIPPETIERALGSANVWVATTLAAAAGSITLIPAFVAFPLVGSLVKAGASIVPGVAFLTTLTMVGIVTFPLEKKEFGLKFALTRNLLSFAAAMGIALMMGVVL